MAQGKKIVVELDKAADQTSSRLLGLPAELRNRIWEMVFAGNHVRVRTRMKYQHNLEPPPKAPSIVVACKQTFAEAISIYYFESIFIVDDKIELMLWLRQIGLSHQQRLRCIRYENTIDHHSLQRSKLWLRFKGEITACYRGAVLSQIRTPGVIVGDDKIFARFYLPGMKILWTREPRKVAEGLIHLLKEIEEKHDGEISPQVAWNEMINTFRCDST